MLVFFSVGSKYIQKKRKTTQHKKTLFEPVGLNYQTQGKPDSKSTNRSRNIYGSFAANNLHRRYCQRRKSRVYRCK